MKPKFILFVGYGWAATTPLFNSLKEHLLFGTQKEMHYFELIWKKHYYKDPKNWGKGAKDRRGWEKTFELHLARVKQARYGEDNYDQNIFVPDKAFDILEDPNTCIENYINFYKSIWEKHADDGKILADWSNSNILPINDKTVGLPLYKEFIQRLQEHFDVTQVGIFRDPVRRLFSQHVWHWDNADLLRIDKSLHHTVENYLEFYAKKVLPYSDIIDVTRKYGKTEFFVMEDIWENDTKNQLSRLENLIGKNINLYDNAYSPDRGSKAIRYTLLIDQWNTDSFDMPDNLYYKLKKILQYQYDYWPKVFGCLPEQWGTPIDYKKNQSLPIGRIEHEGNFVPEENRELIDGEYYWKDFDNTFLLDGMDDFFTKFEVVSK